MPKPAPIQEFVPTNVVSLDDLLEGVVEPSQNEPKTQDPVPPAPIVEPVVLPPESPDPNDEPGDITKFEPSNQGNQDTEPTPPKQKKGDNSAMRAQLQKLAKEKADYEAKVAEFEKEREDAKKLAEQLQAERDQVRQQFDELSVRSQIGNPLAHPDIRKLTEPWNAKVPQLTTQLRESGLKTHQLDSWLGDRVRQYLDAGDPESDDFVDKMESLRDEVDQFTSGIRRDSDRASAQDKIMAMIRDGASVGRQVQASIREMQANAPVFHYREQLAQYENEAKEYESIERDFFNPSEDIRMNDPLNQRVILKAMIEGSAEVKKAAENAKLFSKMASLPIRPINPSDLEQIEPEKRQEAILRHMSRHTEVKKRAVKLIPEALVAYAVLPALWQELEQLRSRVKGDRQVPKPGAPLPNHRPEEEEEASITEFEPTNPDFSKIPL